MYYPCSENKGADQLRGYREADLRLCFRIYKNPVFSRRGSIIFDVVFVYIYSVMSECEPSREKSDQLQLMRDAISPSHWLFCKVLNHLTIFFQNSIADCKTGSELLKESLTLPPLSFQIFIGDRFTKQV